MKYQRLLLGFSLCQLAGFVALAWWAHKHPQDGTDIALTHIFQHKQSQGLRRIVLVWSTLTSDATLLNLLTFPVALVLWLRQRRLEAIMTALTSWSMLLIRVLVKQLIHRPRPSPLLVHVTDHKKSKSFPSGHVASAVSLWGWLLGLGLIRRADLSGKEKALLSIPALFIASAGPARVYLGEHWASDVLGGYLLAGGWVGLCLRLYLLLRGQARQHYRIPLRQEQVVIEKRPVVAEELIVGKKKVEETQHFTDTVLREEPYIERSGNIRVQSNGINVEDVQSDVNTPQETDGR